MHLWIREINKTVWHLTNGRTAPLRYTVVCGCNLQERPGAVWPQKPNELGPEDPCHDCFPKRGHRQGAMFAAVRAATGQWGEA